MAKRQGIGYNMGERECPEVIAKVLETLEYSKILHKLAHHAATDLGKQWAVELSPSTDLEEVKLRLQATDEAYHVDRLKGGAPFGGISDIRGALQRARIGAMLSPYELLQTADTIAGGRRLRKFLEAVHKETHPIPLLAEQCEQLSEDRTAETQIRSCINDQAEVMDSASPELQTVRRELRNGESRIREKLEQMIRSSSVQKMLQDQIITIRNGRYVIPVKQEYRSALGGIIHDQSGSGATLFIEPEAAVAMNNRLRELKLREEQEIEKILRRLTALVETEVDSLVIHVDALAALDFIFAKAGLAHELKATMPRMNDRGFLKLKKGRHPLISADQVVPIDVELGNEYTAIIVTGPNTGGKTVSLKTIGLLSLMGMSGLFIPAEEGSQLCVFDAIYADIGDEQSIEQSLSTFSSHLTNIISILRNMTPKSLVLLDELGAGTDPAEGSALAIALLEHIHHLGCRIIATTHYSELKAYAYERKGIINASMEFDVQTLSPTYRLLIGVPGRSNAFAIAERLGLSRSIIDSARGQVREDDKRVETMIASLEENRITAETERREAERIRREAEQLRKQAEAERSRFEEQRSKLLEKAQRDAKEAVAKARREAEEIITELRKLAMEERSSIKEHKLIEARRRLDDAAPDLASKPERQKRAGHAGKPEPGDEVMVYSLNQKGYVVEVHGDKEATVQLGILKMKVKLSDVEKLHPARADKPAQHVTSVKRSNDSAVRTELDLRGASLDEALVEVDRFIDEAIMSNLGQVYIIHGKGTGVLRTGIQQYLQNHRQVKSHRLGNFGEGGSGVTVAEFS